ncbi:MAG: DNA replication/repair protein RecF [Myxococcales bacterium]
MKLLSFAFADFRNLERVEAAPHPRFTVVAGENGQGKTNLLEGIYYLLALRPLRSAKPRDLIRAGELRARLTARLERGGVAEELSARIEPEGRQLFHDGKAATDLGRYLEGGTVVAFTPDDLALVRAGPDRRRRFVDRAVFNRWPAYLEESREYQRLLRSRNRLLLENAPPALRESFEVPLARSGARLVERRRAWLMEIREPLAEAWERIGRLPGGLVARYSGPPEDFDVERWLREELTARFERDRERGFTSVGPHADDVRFTLEGRDARRFASQGQSRALVLSLKVAEIENLRERLGAPPLLLLDDVSSELDPERNRELLSYLADLPAQVLLTTTDPTPLLGRLEGRSTLWRVQRGQLTASGEGV